MNNKPERKSPLFDRKYFIVLIVCIITGFIIGYSYNLSKDNGSRESISDLYNSQESGYREDLIKQQERNKQLTDELAALEKKIRDYEKEFASNETAYDDLVKDAQQLRLTLGLIASEGEGLRITLKDGDYDPATTNPNDYIVHESHIFLVLNELKISGADAISINGQRLKANSYVSCNGPVITIDGKQHPAPFTIEAVGKQDVLSASLELAGGVLDKLLNDNIVVTVEESDSIQMPSVNTES